MKRKRKGMPTWLFVTILSVGIAVGVGILALVLAFVWAQVGRNNAPAVQLVPFVAQPVGPPKTFASKTFTLTYPSTWRVDEKNKKYNPDHYVPIYDAPGDAMVIFLVSAGSLDPAETLEDRVKDQSENLTNVKRTDFTRWGKYDGKGAVLHGKMIEEGNATLRIFSFNAGMKTFVITEYFLDDQKQMLAPGYQTIENSFRVME